MPNHQIQTITTGILTYLKSRKLLHLLPEIIQALQSNLLDTKQIVIESAIALSDQQKQHIATLLAKNYQLESPIDFKINSDLIAGIRINLGDQILDASVKAQVEELYAS